MPDLMELAERYEKAEPSEQRKLLQEAGEATLVPEGDYGKLARFFGFLDAGAYIDAAMTLVPSPAEYPTSKTFVLDCAGQTTEHMGTPVAHVWNEAGKHTGKGRTPALALTAAALRARASTEGEG